MKKMTRRKQLKLDKKKRKKKLERRAAVVPELAYTGNKYRKEKYIPIILAAETAILEAFVISGRKMTDNDVRHCLTTLIGWLRRGRVPTLEDLSPEHQRVFGAEDFLAWNILDHWRHRFAGESPVARDTLVGVLRTTLGSIDVWGSKGPRGYLEYLEDFLGEMGVSVRELSPEEAESLEIIQDEVDPWPATGRDCRFLP